MPRLIAPCVAAGLSCASVLASCWVPLDTPADLDDASALLDAVAASDAPPGADLPPPTPPDLAGSDLCPGPPTVDLAGMVAAPGCAHFAREWCLKDLACNVAFYRSWASEAACEADLVGRCAAIQAEAGLSNVAQLDACAGTIAALSCNLFDFGWINHTLCVVSAGATALGGACKLDADCQSTWCSPGGCAPASSEGGPCVNGQCSRGYFCDVFSCVAVLGLGKRCALAEAPPNRRCSAPYYCCLRGGDIVPVCVAPLRLGERCGADCQQSACACCGAGLVCDGNSRTCVRAAGACH